MLSILLSLGHIDTLMWCEFGIIGILALGTLALHIGGTRAHRSELSVTIMGLIAIVAAVMTDNLAVLSLAFALALIAASCLALHAERAANAKARLTIMVVCGFAAVLYVIGAYLFSWFNLSNQQPAAFCNRISYGDVSCQSHLLRNRKGGL